jgi:hypothetical protein
MASHDRVAHAFIHQTGTDRRGFNMFYVGRTIYSHGYHWPLATLHMSPATNDLVLMVNRRNRGRSMTTTKHDTILGRANGYGAHQVHPVFRVVAGYERTPTEEAHRANLTAWIADAGHAVDKAKRARVYKASWIDTAERALEDAREYCQAWGLDLALVPASLDALEPAMAEIRAAAARQEAQEAERRRREYMAARLARREEAKRQHPQWLAWLNGEPDAMRPDYYAPTFCRVRGDQVETSRGAMVPLNDAMRLARLALHVRRNLRREYIPEHRPNCGPYRLDRIDRMGGLHIGCHHLSWQAISIAAKKAGIEITVPQAAD